MTNPYSPPGAFANGPGHRAAGISLLFRGALWALIAPFVAFAILVFSPSRLLFGVFLLAFFTAPTFWMLWPEFRQGGFRAVSSGRFLMVSVGAAGAACLAALIYWVLLGVGYLIWEQLGYGT